MKVLLTAILLALSGIAAAQSDAERAALALIQAGKPAEAIMAFRRIVAADPGNASATDALAQLLYAQGQYQDSHNTAMKGLAATPGSVNLSITRAKAAIRLGHADEAIQLMDGLINIDGSFFYPFYVRGQALDAQGRQQQAIGMYSRSIALNPEFPMAWYDRASDFYMIGRDEQALPDIKEFLRMAPDHDGGLNLRGSIYARMNQPDVAIESFDAAIVANPRQHLAYANRGQAYEVLGRMAEAEADYRKAIRIDTSYAPAYFYLAALLSARRDNGAALGAIRDALALRPQETDYHAVAARILLSLERYPEGLAEAELVIAADERSADGWLFKASALSRMKQFDRSITTLNTAISKFPDNYLFYALRGHVYRQQGKSAEAAADEAKAQSLGTKY